MVTVTLTDPVKLGADWLMPGDIREVTPEEAAALREAGVVATNDLAGEPPQTAPAGVVATDDLAGEPPQTAPPVAAAKPSGRARAAKG